MDDLYVCMSYPQSVGTGSPSERCFSKLVDMLGKSDDAKDQQHLVAAHVLLANIYSQLGRYDDYERVFGAFKERSFRKIPGISTIEIDGRVHTSLMCTR